MSAYREAFESAERHPDEFWLAAAEAIDWTTPPTRGLDDSAVPHYRWFPDGRLNTCYNALDRHIEAGNGDRPALIYDSAMIGVQRSFSYAELLDQVARLAGVLVAQGVTAGDRVVVYMPMIPEAVIAMLACARIGAVHSVVFGGFAANELAARIDDAAPVALLTASGGLEPGRTVEYLPEVAKALAMCAEALATVIVKNRDEIPGQVTDPL